MAKITVPSGITGWNLEPEQKQPSKHLTIHVDYQQTAKGWAGVWSWDFHDGQIVTGCTWPPVGSRQALCDGLDNWTYRLWDMLPGPKYIEQTFAHKVGQAS